MEVIKPNELLLKFGFSQFDIDTLSLVLADLEKKGIIEVIDIPDQLFQFGDFVKCAICYKNFRSNLIEAYSHVLEDLENTLLSQMIFDATSMHFKLNLFILIIFSLEKDQKVNPLYNQYLELDKKSPKSYITLLDAFFEMVRTNVLSVEDCYNIFQTSNLIERSGWTLSYVPTPHKESIGEHMYNAYLIGLLYLPEKTADVDYNKSKILKMILLHDLGETLTGDIPHPSKTANDEIVENLKMKALCCTLLYNEIPSASEIFELWNEWVTNFDINAAIAHDLDVIQLNYQFFTYAHNYPETFSDEEILKWTRRQPKTEIGKEIYRVLILNNHKFKERISVLNGRK